MFKIVLTWYRAKTYCPVIDSLRSEPEMWVSSTAYRAHKMSQYKPKFKGDIPSSYMFPRYDSGSLYHKELGIEIESCEHPYRKVKRNGHILPVPSAALHNALMDRKLAAERKVKEDARAELNRVTQDAQTLRLKRIVELRKALAVAEAADFAHRLEHNAHSNI